MSLQYTIFFALAMLAGGLMRGRRLVAAPAATEPATSNPAAAATATAATRWRDLGIGHSFRTSVRSACARPVLAVIGRIDDRRVRPPGRSQDAAVVCAGAPSADLDRLRGGRYRRTSPMRARIGVALAASVALAAAANAHAATFTVTRPDDPAPGAC